MKKILVTLSLLVVFGVAAMAQNGTAAAQNADSVIIKISQDNIFSKCFMGVDTNQDGNVTVAEAAAAEELVLGRGGRKNIISNYDFLKFFPNLKRLEIGNTPNEEVDLRKNWKLEVLDLRVGIFLKKITLSVGCYPKIIYPKGTGDFTVTRVSNPDDPNSIWLE